MNKLKDFINGRIDEFISNCDELLNMFKDTDCSAISISGTIYDMAKQLESAATSLSVAPFCAMFVILTDKRPDFLRELVGL